MLGKSLIRRSLESPLDDRVFIYEVKGLKQNYQKHSNRYLFRTSSGSIFLKVPYSQMNQQMRRIALLGDKIVNVSPLEVTIKQ